MVTSTPSQLRLVPLQEALYERGLSPVGESFIIGARRNTFVPPSPDYAGDIATFGLEEAARRIGERDVSNFHVWLFGILTQYGARPEVDPDAVGLHAVVVGEQPPTEPQHPLYAANPLNQYRAFMARTTWRDLSDALHFTGGHLVETIPDRFRGKEFGYDDKASLFKPKTDTGRWEVH